MKSTKNSILNYLRYSVVSRSLLLLSKRDRIKILIVALIQIFLGFLDLASVIIIGLLGALSISGVQSQGPGTRVKSVLDLLNLSDNSFQYQCAVLGIVAAIFLVIKTILSMFFIKKTLFFLANKASALSSELFSRMLNQNLLQLQVKNSQEKLFAITEGVKLITVNVIGNLILLISDISLLLVMFFGLIFLDTYVAIITFAGFGILAFILYRTMSVKAQKIGKKNTEVTIKSNELILESFNTYRENVVRNRRYYYWQKVNISRSQLASYQAELAFMPNMSKYILESAMILGSLGLCAIMFLTKDAVHAFATLALFLGAVSRIVPAILRIQQGAVSIKAGIGSAHITIDLIESLSEIPKIKESFDPVDLKYRDFESVVIIKNLSLTYPDQEIKALNEINLRIDAGTSVAVVGPSGAGKTSLVDVILGIIEPSSGTVSISGFNPLEAIAKWPGAIGYVPQNTVISQGSVRSNVTLGYPIGAFSDQLIWDAIEAAQLKDFVLGLPGELEATLGEGGAKISGGQRQRIGIARALITNPKLLILDEATSSLDSQVESSISSSINSLAGRVTVITIAHRLSTVRDSNKVVFIEKGKILSEGSFAKVRGEVPNFDAQAKLMGL